MSRRDGQRHLRQVVCSGCERRCRYADFRAFGRYAGGFAPPRNWPGERRRRRERGHIPSSAHGGRQLFGEQARETFSAIPCGTRHTVLGLMFKTKQELWREYTEVCQASLSTPPSPPPHQPCHCTEDDV